MPKRKDLGQALYLAVVHKRYKEARKLLQAMADPDWQDPRTLETSLHHAAEHGLTDLGILLLSYDASTTYKNRESHTALELAGLSNQWSFIQKVVYNSTSFTPFDLGNALLIAAENNELETVLCLIATKAQPTWYKTQTKNTALHFAAIHNNPAMVAALVAAGAKTNLYNNDNETPIEIAIRLAPTHVNGWETVLAFTPNYRPKNISLQFIVHSLSEVINANSKQNIDNVTKKNYFTSNSQTARSKDDLLKQILAINNLELRQKALWQALDPETYLGRIFHLQRGWKKPSVNSGRLKVIANELKKLLKTQPIKIHQDVFANIYTNIQIIKIFPQLMPANPIPQIESIIVNIFPKEKHNLKWAKVAYGSDNGQNKDKVLDQIDRIQDPKLKQRAYWQALQPDTYLGYIFQTPRSWFSTSYYRGRLLKIIRAITQLFQNHSISIDTSIANSLQKDYRLNKLFRMSTNAKDLGDQPPTYTSSTAQIIDYGIQPLYNTGVAEKTLLSPSVTMPPTAPFADGVAQVGEPDVNEQRSSFTIS